MKKISILVILSLFVFCVACEKYNEKERRRVAEEWIRAAESVVRATGDREAEYIFNTIKESSFLAAPSVNKDGEMIIQAIDDTPSASYRLALLPLFPDDRKINKDWKRNYETDEYASFIRYTNNVGLITLKNKVQLSEIRKGIILLHEGAHVLIFINGKLRDLEQKDDRIAAAVDEYHVFRFQFRLVLLLGGEQYGQLLKKATVCLEKLIRADKQFKFKHPWFSEELETIFGKQKTNTELLMLEQELWIAAYVNAIDQIYGRDSKKGDIKKFRLFYRFYENKSE